LKLSFAKLSGAGNDFVLLENPRGSGFSALARKLCDRRRGVGADGLLVLKRSPKLSLTYYNADGSAAFCGNGSRCAAWWMFRRGWTKGRKNFEFRTSEGLLSARVLTNGRVAIRMPEARVLGFKKLRVEGKTLAAHWLDTGVPHAVIFVRGLSKFPVEKLGRAVRYHKAFGRAGVNADFVESGRVRTYERGVEAETLACGTGVVASALASNLIGRGKSPVNLKVASGQTLSVNFRRDGNRFKDIWLEGPAELVFQGELK
jgi:diaminopimelate epimerase